MPTVSMRHKYRLAAVDMDGTLLRGDKTIGQRTVRAMNEALAQGVEVVIATGRSRAQTWHYTELFPAMRYVISSSGAAVYDLQRNWEKIISNEIPPELVLEILDYAKRLDCFPIVAANGQTHYTAGMAEQAPAYGLGAYVYEMKHFGTAVDSIFDWYSEFRQPVESIALYFRDRQFCPAVVAHLEHLPLYFAMPAEPSVEMSMKTANKGCALEQLCRRLGISREAALAMGDSDNDVPMLKAAGLAVVSGNAPPAVQELADFVSADCDHDGVAVALERFVLQPESLA